MREIRWFGIALAATLAGCSADDAQRDEAADADQQTPQVNATDQEVAFFVDGQRVQSEPIRRDPARLLIRVAAAHQPFVRAAAPHLLARLKNRQLAPESVATAAMQGLAAELAAADLAVDATVAEVSGVVGAEDGISTGYRVVTFTTNNSLLGEAPAQVMLRFANETQRSQDVPALPAVGARYLLLLQRHGLEQQWSPRINGIKRVDRGRLPGLGVFTLELTDLSAAVTNAAKEVAR